jgi:hypothetical protein
MNRVLVFFGAIMLAYITWVLLGITYAVLRRLFAFLFFRWSSSIRQREPVDLQVTLQSQLSRFVERGCPQGYLYDPNLAIQMLEEPVIEMWRTTIEPRWRPSGPSYPPDWIWRRHFVFKRDNYRCTKCHVQTKNYDCHHVVSRARGGDNSLENLVTLCATCHSRAHPRNLMLRNRAKRRGI